MNPRAHAQGEEKTMRRNKGWKLAAGVVALSLAAAACGGDDGGSSEAPSSEAPATECEETTPVKLQLQWFIQAQFAGYFAAQD
ncbi:MAG: hypothetical protein ACO276_08475, partial [Ilumatobacteraceae bacterium]